MFIALYITVIITYWHTVFVYINYLIVKFGFTFLKCMFNFNTVLKFFV